MGSTTSPVKPRAQTLGGSERDAKELEWAIVRSRAEITKTLEALHGRLNPRVMKEDLLAQLKEGKDALKADLQAELHDAKAALGAEYHDIKDHVATSVKTEISDAKAALREATVGKVETMVQSTRESVSNAGRSLVSTVKENPIPAALVGVGLIWMFTNSRSASKSQSLGSNGSGSRLPTSEPSGIAEGVSKMARQAKTSVSDAAHAAGESLEDAATRVKTSVSDAAQATSREVSHLAHAAGAAGEKAGQRAGVLFTENPLAVGAAVLVAGALVGMAIPTTNKETEWMGDARQKLAKRAGRFAHKVGSDLHEGAENLAQEMKKSVEQATNDRGAGETHHA